MISVVIPVGPKPHHARWLNECLASVAVQTMPPDEVILVDDMHGVGFTAFRSLFPDKVLMGEDESTLEPGSFIVGPYHDRPTRGIIWRSPWHLGVPAAFNMGVGLASQPLICMLGADDVLMPRALEEAYHAWNGADRAMGYYYFTIEYSDTGEVQSLPCNCAVTTKDLWVHTGGFPPESSVGACDTMLISMLLKKRPDLLRPIAEGQPLYGYRRHQETDTATRDLRWQGPIFSVRDILTDSWEPPLWGRY